MKLSIAQRKSLAIGGMLVATLIWGTSFAIMKIALESLTPLWFVTSRFAPAALILAIICGKKLKMINKSLLRDGTAVGLALAAAYTTLMIGLQDTTASNGAFISGTYVVIVPFLLWFFTKKIHYANFILAFATLLGIALISLTAEFQIEVGDLWVLASAFMFALHLTLLSKYSPQYDTFLLSLMQLIAVALVNALLALLIEPLPQVATFSPQLIYAIAYCAVFPSVIAYLLQTVAQKIISPVAVSVLLMAQTIFCAFFSWLWLDELFSPRQFIGAAILIICMVISVLLDYRPPRGGVPAGADKETPRDE